MLPAVSFRNQARRSAHRGAPHRIEEEGLDGAG